MPTSKAWPDKETQVKFFRELEELIDRYPHFKARDLDDFDEPNVVNEHDEPFDPESPVIRQGVILLISHTNLEHFEDIQILTPYSQSFYLSLGMLQRANEVWTED